MRPCSPYQLGKVPGNNTERDNMKETLTQSQFCHRFKEVRPDNFSWAALEALFEYFEEYEDSCGDEIEFDPIAICCDFSEHDSALACIEDMGYDFTPDEDEDSEEQEESALEWLRDQTTVIEFDGGIIIQGF